MANIPDKNLVEFPGFPRGLDNLSEENAVGPGALREAVNVDLDGNGRVSRRSGYTRVKTGPFHSVFSADSEALFAVADGTLTAYDSNLAATPLRTEMGEAPVSYAVAGMQLFWSNGADIGAVSIGSLATMEVWPQTPAQPAVAVAAVGGLAEGEYQIALTVKDAYGRESGATLAAMLSVPEGGGIQLSSIPNLPDYPTLRVYVTTPGGEIFYHARDIDMGTATLIIGVGQRGRELGSRQWWQPMPAGQAMAFAAGRLWVASGPYLYYSEPMAPGAMLPDNYIKLSPHVDVLAPVGEGPNAGLFVGAGKRTLYLTGPDPKTMNMLIARPSGAVPGTYHATHTSAFAEAIPNVEASTAALWLSADGVFCLGLPGGRVLPLNQRRMATTTDAERGAILHREDAGANQFVASVQGGTSPRAAASDQLVGTVYRGGIELN